MSSATATKKIKEISDKAEWAAFNRYSDILRSKYFLGLVQLGLLGLLGLYYMISNIVIQSLRLLS
jgi:hypothetical protein